MKVLGIKSVKCISPSSGVNTFTRVIFGSIGAAVAGATTVAAGTVTGGVLIAATGLAAAGGASTGVAVITGLDRVFAGSDDLYVKVNNTKVWPAKGKYTSANSQQTLAVDHTIALRSKVTIELFDYDTISSDDTLGYLTLEPDHQVGRFTYVVRNSDEGSVYEVNIAVVDERFARYKEVATSKS